MRDALEELRALGTRGLVFRLGWEARMRWTGFRDAAPTTLPSGTPDDWSRRLFLPDPDTVAQRIGPWIDARARAALAAEASAGLRGRIVAFRRWTADYGDPPDWSINPTNGARWPDVPWWRVLTFEPEVGDVKLTWEIGRFPHAWVAARAATLDPPSREAIAQATLAHWRQFVAENPPGRGVHWQSGQEIAFRLFAWVFALDVCLARTAVRREAVALVGDALAVAAAHVEAHVNYARWAVYNNHLLSEALLLYLAGVLLADLPDAHRWRVRGRALLDEGVARQFYPDGGYIQQSHNYHRVALQLLVFATRVARAHGDGDSPSWHAAIDRSIRFLYAHQNPADGWLPNYGGNDGALPLVASTCAFPDFRPTLQAASLLVRGARLYPAGPWDEEAAWLVGPAALDAPLDVPPQGSTSFPETGHHVLRGDRAGDFVTFRCGTLRDRFTQIDPHHVGAWWRGHNVLCDAGSYLYNGSDRWHHHFCAGATHNAVTVDGAEPMRHHRRFKFLYPPNARLIEFDPGRRVVGEHDGFVREAGCLHRRAVLRLGDEVWAVVDDVSDVDGSSREHTLRLHWLAGLFGDETGDVDGLPAPWRRDPDGAGLTARRPDGVFALRAADADGHPLVGTVVAGADPKDGVPRGWLSRYYGEKLPVPSFAAERRGPTPLRVVSVFGTGPLTIRPDGPGAMIVEAPAGRWRLRVAELVSEALP